MSDSGKHTAISLKWSALERILTQGIQFVVMMVLARMLGPDAFGLIGLITIFISLSQIIVESGFSLALIRKKNCSTKDYSTAFFINVFLSGIVYFFLYLTAPLISDFYGEKVLIVLVRVIGFSVVINGFSVVFRAILTKEMNFKALALISFIGVILGSLSALCLAYAGFGVWALVSQSLVMNFVSLALMFNCSSWRPSGDFCIESARYLIKFGSGLLSSNILSSLGENIYPIIIGKFFSKSNVGYYTQSKQISSLPAMTLTLIMQRVTFPLFSKIQDDGLILEKSFFVALRLSAMIIFPLISMLGVLAWPLTDLVLGTAWSPIAGLIAILCVGFMLYPIHALNLNMLLVKGEPGIYFKLEIIKLVLNVAILIVTIHFGVFVMCLGVTIHSYLSLIINMYYTSRVVSVKSINQLKNIFPFFAFSFLACLFSFISIEQVDTAYLKLLFGVISGGGVYFLLVRVFFESEFLMIKKAIVN